METGWSRRAVLAGGLAGLGLPRAASARGPAGRRLALLLAVPWPGETAMHHDQEAMYAALLRRGFHSAEILSLDGQAGRDLVLGLLGEVRRRTARWADGDVFLYFSGHGAYREGAAGDLRPALLLPHPAGGGREERLDWDEVFAALRLPPGVRLLLLPDC